MNRTVAVAGSKYEQVYALVRRVPAGRVVSYGQVARHVPGCTARMVGYAMSALPDGSDVPWQRVINGQGRVSPRAVPGREKLQQALLEDEGVFFDDSGKTDFCRFGFSFKKGS